MCVSTETALLKVVNDLLTVLDNGKISFPSLIDLSAAFDTVDHIILLSRIESSYSICDTAVAWFRSYLINRSQTVSVSMVYSPSTSLVLFVLYKPLSAVNNHHSLLHESFVDDTQLSTSDQMSEL